MRDCNLVFLTQETLELKILEKVTLKMWKYEVYCQMLADWFGEPIEKAKSKAEDFEKQVKDLFVDEPGRMKLLIVVDKLLALMPYCHLLVHR